MSGISPSEAPKVLAAEICNYAGIEKGGIDSLFYPLADMSPDGVIIHINAEILYANQAIADLLKFSTGQDLLGHTVYDFILPAGHEIFDCRLRGVHVERLRLPFQEYSLKRKNGSILHVEMCSQPVLWNGKIAAQTIVRDLTDKYKNEDVFRTLSRAVEQCPDSVIIADHRGVVEYVNPYFEERSGYSLTEIAEKKTIFLLRGMMPRKDYSNMMQIISEGRVWKGEFAIYSKSGKRYWEQASVSPVLDKNGDICHYICIMKDITAWKNTEHNLQQALKTANDANKAKSVFLANMSHELRTPLNAIIGFNSLLVSAPEDFVKEKVREYSLYAQKAGEHLLTLVNDLLDLAKIEEDKLILEEQFFSASDLVKNVVKLVAEKAGENQCELVIDISDQFILFADSRRIQQILLNIIYNAVKFTENGRVTIEATEVLDGTICIRDTGIGMSDFDIELAISPFGQAEKGSLAKKYDGAGLGLPIAKKLMELHSGSLVIQSELGVGTAVILTFPIDRISTS